MYKAHTTTLNVSMYTSKYTLAQVHACLTHRLPKDTPPQCAISKTSAPLVERIPRAPSLCPPSDRGALADLLHHCVELGGARG